MALVVFIGTTSLTPTTAFPNQIKVDPTFFEETGSDRNPEFEPALPRPEDEDEVRSVEDDKTLSPMDLTLLVTPSRITYLAPISGSC